MNFNITSYSTALFSTWFFIDELGLLFDAGDGVSSALLQKSRKVKNIFISHADRDHLNGIPQFNQLNARDGYPKIYFPSSSGSFPALQQFLEKFDPHVQGAEWFPINEEMEFHLKGNLFVKPIKNGHVVAEDHLTKSLSYLVVEKRRKIKKEFAHLKGNEIAILSKEKGKEFITSEYQTSLIGYSGDTPVEDYYRWNHTKILIHESTFLTKTDSLNNTANRHSNLEEVMEMVSGINIEYLILSHFSSRYSKQEIDAAILKNCSKYKVQIPVFRILPGQLHRDILKEQPINS